MRKKALLLGTLGGSWAIIPELLGFTNPEQINLFAQRSDIPEICADLPVIDEIWLATTVGEIALKACENLREWQRLIGGASPVIRIWAPAGINDLTTQHAADSMRELIWRLALRACDERGSNNVCFCLAGGRKTMSADLQQAASLFGGMQLLHLIEPGKLPDYLREARPATFVGSLTKIDAQLFQPVIIDRNLIKAEILELKGERDGQTVNTGRFPLALAEEVGGACLVEVTNDLQNTIEERRKRARNLLFHYAGSLSQCSKGQSFQALHILPPSLIDSLQNSKIGKDKASEAEDLRWLKQLPKADLHCHLGGIANADDLVRVAEAMKEDIEKATNDRLRDKQAEWRDILLNQGPVALKQSFLINDSKFKDALNRISTETQIAPWLVNAAFIGTFKDSHRLLDEFIFAENLNPENFHKTDIADYEKLGDLQGSSLLQTESSIREMCRILVEKCQEENVRYFEVRCSPVNYVKGGLTESEVVAIIQSELGKGAPKLNAGLIIIGSRHRRISDCCRHVELATEILADEWNDHNVPLVGFDLAGDEKFDAEAFAPIFRPLFEKCLHITVHAGETQSVESIWKAVYTLNAERIGHGLKLGSMPKLINHFLDRGIAIEMCPSSNCQIVGFKDHFLSSTEIFENYPLKNYLNLGLKVTVNTDNPGISRTSASFELQRAARLTHGGLSRWDILQLIKNGFSAAFTQFEKRRELILQAEKDILTLIEQDND